MYNSDNHTFKPIMLMFIAETISNTSFKLNFKKNFVQCPILLIPSTLKIKILLNF